MLAAIWVVMGHGVSKGIVHPAGTAGSLVDMKSKNLLLAEELSFGQAGDLGKNNHTCIGLIQLHSSGDASARNICHRLGPAA